MWCIMCSIQEIRLEIFSTNLQGLATGSVSCSSQVLVSEKTKQAVVQFFNANIICRFSA